MEPPSTTPNPAAVTPITARLATAHAIADASQTRALIMWMPGGTHEISATNSATGQPQVVKVSVDRDTAAVAQQSLEAHLKASRQRPYFDFDHDNREASAWPHAFRWQDSPEPGVYAEVEWSAAGVAAVNGKSHRGFSPSFALDLSVNPGRVVGVPLNMGGLVNNPAFKQIRPLWAREASNPMNDNEAGKAGTQNPTPAAAENPTKPASAAQDGAAILTLLDAKSSLEAKDQEIANLQAKNNRLEGDLKARRKTDAEAAVKSAVERGALPSQDTELQAKWVAKIEADPDMATILAKVGPAPEVVTGRITPTTEHRVELTASDVRRALKAYFDAKDPAQRGAIYCGDIKRRIAKDDGQFVHVMQAANSLGTVAGELIVQRSLDLLKVSFPMLSRISTDFSGENAAFGQAVKSRLRTVPTVTDYNTTTGYATSDATTTDVSVTISAHKAVQVSFNANELASTRRLLFGEQEEGMHYAIGKVLVDALLALITAGNYTNATTKALASFGRNDVTAMAKAMYDRNVPPMMRTLLLNTAYFEKLQQDSTIVNLAAYQRPEVITEYTLPPIAGFQPFQAVNLPTTANLTGFGLTPSTMVVATRLPNDYTQVLPGATGGGVVSTVTNPDTGISVMLVQFIDHKLGAALLRVALMYGVAVGDPATGQRLISA